MTKKETYFSDVKRELGSKLFKMEMDVNGKHWGYCLFVSDRKKIVYFMTIKTVYEKAFELMLTGSYDELYKQIDMTDISDQSTEILAKVKMNMIQKLKNGEKLQINPCIKYDEYFNRNIFTALECIVDEEYLTEELIEKIIKAFLMHKEEEFIEINYVLNTEKVIQYLNPYKNGE